MVQSNGCAGFQKCRVSRTRWNMTRVLTLLEVFPDEDLCHRRPSSISPILPGNADSAFCAATISACHFVLEGGFLRSTASLNPWSLTIACVLVFGWIFLKNPNDLVVPIVPAVQPDPGTHITATNTWSAGFINSTYIAFALFQISASPTTTNGSGGTWPCYV